MFLLQAVTIPNELPANIDLSNFGDSALGSMFAVFGAFILVVAIVSVIVIILALIDIYHWAMTDNSAFVKAGESKKKWFVNLIVVPLIAIFIMSIPLLGWIVGVILYIYYLVMVLVYFFSTRKKVGVKV